MSSAEPSHAVFLSYAREDTGAARRIAGALRDFGVEVWFDQSELRGGDAWDAKIKQQIRECALFLPVVSAHTQERSEGYFRREWKLAVERTHNIADGVPFLVPVVIDDTREAGASVPEPFMHVQWTRLPGALPTPQFVDQVRRLLAAPRGPVSAQSSRISPGSRSAPPARAAGIPKWIYATAAVAVLALVAYLALRPPVNVPAVPVNPANAESKPGVPPASVAPVVNDKSIAVLPFDNRSAEKENAYFTDGIQDDILTSLANLHELHVISRTSVMEYRGTTKRIPQVARELGVAYVLEGAVERVGNAVRITGQLIRAATDDHIWAKSYDRELTATNLFAIQSELAQAIAGELQAALSPEEKTQLGHAPTSNLAAYDAYSKARDIFYARGNDIAAMFKEATPLFERAVALDQNFAEAWAGVGEAYSLAYNRRIERTAEGKARALGAIQTALRLAPDNPAVILASAHYYTFADDDYERALVECERAARISPSNSGVYNTLVSIYFRQDRGSEALAAARKAYELNPRSESLLRSLGAALMCARRYTEAEDVLRQALALRPDSVEAGAMLASIPLWTRGSTRELDAWLASQPASSRANGTFQTVQLQAIATKGDAIEYVRLVERYHREDIVGYGYPLALTLAGETGRARTVAARYRDEQLAILTREPNDGPVLSRLAFAYAALGENDLALEAADKSVSPDRSTNQTLSANGLALRRAEVLAGIGKKDEAIAELTRILRTSNPIGADPLTSFVWAPLKGDPRFEAIKSDPQYTQPLY